MTLWLTADTHFGHARINDLCDRGFSDVEAMNDGIVESFREVLPSDTLLHLGDVAMGGWRETLGYMARIPGRKVLVPGNHDVVHPMDKRHARPDVVEAYSAVFDEIHVSLTIGDLLASHFPFSGDSQGEDRYSEWRPQDNESISGLIHGHVHTAWRANLSGDTPQINVGWDVWRRPVSLDEVRWYINGA